LEVPCGSILTRSSCFATGARFRSRTNRYRC
jgi:hypothetical protein